MDTYPAATSARKGALMANPVHSVKRSATQLTASAIGAIVGMAGIEHGVGEALQGNVATSGLVFPSWGDSPLFRILGGEPAMSLVPNLLATGTLSILVGLLVMVCSLVFITKRRAGPILSLLVVAQLLVGGGLAPIPLGILVGIAATRIQAPLSWWRRHLPTRARRGLAKLWLGSVSVCVSAWLLLFPGLVVLAYLTGMTGSEPMVETLVLAIVLCAVTSLGVTMVAGFAHDVEEGLGNERVANAHLSGI